MRTDFEYIRMIEQPVKAERKTKVFGILNKRQHIQIGTIKWYGAWRQYCIFFDGETVWNAGCLQDILGFLEELKRERG